MTFRIVSALQLVLAGALLLANTSRAETLPPTTSAVADQRDDVRFSRLSPSVWMHTSQKEVEGYGLVPANGLIVIDGANSFLVDTAWNDAQTAAILDWAEATLKKPVKAAVFTHAHADKMGGVGIVRKRGVATYALKLSNELAVKRGLSPAEQALELRENGAAQKLGPLTLFYPGAGHTEDNIVVNIEAAGILFGGCLIRPGESDNLGNTGDGDIGHWAEATAAVERQFPNSKIVVPTHGPPAGRELLDHAMALAKAASVAK